MVKKKNFKKRGSIRKPNRWNPIGGMSYERYKTLMSQGLKDQMDWQRDIKQQISNRKKYGNSGYQRVRKSEGSDHVVQQYGSHDVDLLTVGKFKKIPRSCARNNFQLIHTHQGVFGSATGNTGVQAVEEVCAILNFSQLLTSTGVSYNKNQAPIALFNAIPNDLPPVTLNASSHYFGKTPQTSVAFSKVFVTNINVQLSFCNHSSAGGFYDVYLLKSRGGSNAPATSWSYTGEFGNNVQNIQNTAKASGTTTVSGYPTNDSWGMRPQTSQQFRKAWTVVAVKSYVMAPGGNSQILKMNIKESRIVDRYKVNTENIAYPKGSYYIMIVAKGQQVLQVDATTTGMNQDSVLPSYAPPYGSYIARVCVSYKCLWDKTSASDANILTSNVLITSLNASTKSVNAGTGSSAAITNVT